MEKKQEQLRGARRLKLNRETLRLLRTSDLRQVNGGGTRPAGGTCISCNENATLVCCQQT